ncbi:MAG: hypothetical protein ACP5RW_04265 [bacterium]
MKKGLIFIIKSLFVCVVLLSVIGMDGCSCTSPVIEWIKVFSDINDDGTFSQEVLPDPTTSTYNISTSHSFQIRIKTKEALTSSDLSQSYIQIENQPSFKISEFSGGGNTYYHQFTPNQFSPGSYTANIIIYLNGTPSMGSITLNIAQ